MTVSSIILRARKRTTVIARMAITAVDSTVAERARAKRVARMARRPPTRKMVKTERLPQATDQVLGANATKNPGKGGGGSRRLPPTERRAIEILEAKDHWSKAEIRKAYKKLIKVLHPDMNGGDRSQEEQLQEVVWAWDQINVSRSFK